MKKKKLSVILIGFALVVTMTTAPVSAAEQETQESHFFVSYTGDSQEIQPRLKYLSIVSTNIEPQADYVHCYGLYTAFCEEKITMYVTIQRSRDASTWIEQQSWSESFKPGRGANTVSGNCFSTSPGLYYRVKTTVLVQDDSNKILEGVVVYSRIITR